jgi:hypothetical protein
MRAWRTSDGVVVLEREAGHYVVFGASGEIVDVLEPWGSSTSDEISRMSYCVVDGPKATGLVEYTEVEPDRGEDYRYCSGIKVSGLVPIAAEDCPVPREGLDAAMARFKEERYRRVVGVAPVTQVNGVPVLDARLADGDHIRLGQFQVRFFDGSDEPAREDTPAPEAWRHVAPDRRALIRRIEAIKGKPPESLDENSSLGELGSTFHSVMYVVSTLENECAVRVPMSELTRIHTIGELVDLICNAPKVRGERS